LPVIHREGADFRLYKRNTRLYTPRDFDYSPYFQIIKYPLLGLNDLAVYRQLPWDQEGVVCNDDNDCFIPNTVRQPSKPGKPQLVRGLGPVLQLGKKSRNKPPPTVDHDSANPVLKSEYSPPPGEPPGKDDKSLISDNPTKAS
jgi:hypothetical protein